MNSHRAGSFVLLGGGLVLVFAGLASSLGFSWWGVMSSIAAIVALLYAGAVWFAAPVPAADSPVVLFTHTLVVASGPQLGRPIAEAYPGVNRQILEDACRHALSGHASRFASGPSRFAVSPVRSQEGAVVYGLLLSGAAAAAEASVVMPVA